MPGGTTGRSPRRRLRFAAGVPGGWRGGPRDVGRRRDGSGAVRVLIWSRDSGPRRYDSVHRVWNTIGSASCTLCSRNTRFFSADSTRSISARSTPAAASLRARRARAPCPARSAAGRGTRCRCCQALVVEVDRVLRREHDAEPERPSLLEQRQQRRLRRRVRHRRKVARGSRPCRAARAGWSCRSARASSRPSGSAAATRRTSARRRRGGRSRTPTLAGCPSGV